MIPENVLKFPKLLFFDLMVFFSGLLAWTANYVVPVETF